MVRLFDNWKRNKWLTESNEIINHEISLKKMIYYIWINNKKNNKKHLITYAVLYVDFYSQSF
jgi:hypothetical protein